MVGPAASAQVPASPAFVVVGGWDLPDGSPEQTFAAGAGVLSGGSVLIGWTNWATGHGGVFRYGATGSPGGTIALDAGEQFKVTPSNQIITSTGRYDSLGRPLSGHPAGVPAVAPDGTYYVATTAATNHYSVTGALVGSFPSTDAADLAVLPSGALVYVKNSTLTIRSAVGAVVRSWTLPDNSVSVAVDRRGRIHAVMNWLRRVEVYDPSGSDLGSYDGGPGGGDWISGLSVAATGEIYAVISGPLSGKNRVNRLIDPTDPVVDGVAPNRGPLGGGTVVTVTGVGFAAASGVSFGSVNASFVIVSDTEIHAVAPSAATASTTNIFVTTAGGSTIGAQRSWYTFQGAPSVDAVTPKRGRLSGGETLTVQGRGFTGTTGVRLGTVAATFTVVSDMEIRVVSPVRASPATVNLFVTTPTGTSVSAPGSWFIYAPVPLVQRLEPNRSPIGGGQTVTITGTGFTAASRVRFDQFHDAQSFTVMSDATIVAVTAPRSSSGYVHVFVTTPGGTSVTSTATLFAFTP